MYTFADYLKWIDGIKPDLEAIWEEAQTRVPAGDDNKEDASRYYHVQSRKLLGKLAQVFAGTDNGVFYFGNGLQVRSTLPDFDWTVVEDRGKAQIRSLDFRLYTSPHWLHLNHAGGLMCAQLLECPGTMNIYHHRNLANWFNNPQEARYLQEIPLSRKPQFSISIDTKFSINPYQGRPYDSKYEKDLLMMSAISDLMNLAIEHNIPSFFQNYIGRSGVYNKEA